MNKLGLTDVYLDDKCYLYGKLPATKGYENCPAIGFIAHMDTVSDFCDHSIHPILTKNYNGEALPLGDSGLVLDPKVFPLSFFSQGSYFDHIGWYNDPWCR